jgi:DNA-binding transcriptional regulator of glucitol operon
MASVWLTTTSQEQDAVGKTLRKDDKYIVRVNILRGASTQSPATHLSEMAAAQTRNGHRPKIIARNYSPVQKNTEAKFTQLKRLRA